MSNQLGKRKSYVGLTPGSLARVRDSLTYSRHSIDKPTKAELRAKSTRKSKVGKSDFSTQ